MGVDSLCDSLSFMPYYLPDNPLIHTSFSQKADTCMPGVMWPVVHADNIHGCIPVSIPESIIW